MRPVSRHLTRPALVAVLLLAAAGSTRANEQELRARRIRLPQLDSTVAIVPACYEIFTGRLRVVRSAADCGRYEFFVALAGAGAIVTACRAPRVPKVGHGADGTGRSGGRAGPRGSSGTEG